MAGRVQPEKLVWAAQHLGEWDSPKCLEVVQSLGTEDAEAIRQVIPIVLEGVTATRASTDRTLHLGTLRDRLADLFIGKQDVIDMMIVCAIAQEPMLILGATGTAKSYLVTKFAEGLGVRRVDPQQNGHGRRFFEYMLSQYTEPDELLGPVIVSKLTQAVPEFARFRDGMMPDAYIVFLDEVFRGNSAILNALLSLVNERRVYEAGRAVKANTLILYGAANQIPYTEELRAFYERFPIRVISEMVSDDHRTELLASGWRLETERLAAGNDPLAHPLEQHACLTDLVLLNRAAMVLWDLDVREEIRNGFIETYSEVVAGLNRNTRSMCRIDDRKFIKLYKIIRAYALLKHWSDYSPQPQDLWVLQHTWHDPEMKDMLSLHLDEIIGRLVAREGTAVPAYP